MPVFELKYGSSTQLLHIPQDNTLVDLISPAYTPPYHGNLADLIEGKIAQGFQAKELAALRDPNSTIALVINDKTRPVPHDILLPPLLKFLFRNGAKPHQIVFFIANGTHSPMPSSEFTKILPGEMVGNYRIINPNCDLFEDLHFLGETSRDTPIWVNKYFYQADVKIVVGNIEPHHFMGFSGGIKSAAIGVCGRETITMNHKMIRSPYAKIGLYEKNPMRQDIEEIGDFLGVHYALNVVLNTRRELVHVLFGSPREVMRIGVPLCRDIYQTPVAAPYDLVVASVGGYPKDINFYQSQKAMTHAAEIVRDGGILLLCAECREGSGSIGYEQLMRASANYAEALTRFLEGPFQIGPHKAFQVGKILQRIRFYLVSDLSASVSTALKLNSTSNVQTAFDQLHEDLAPEAKIAIMPNAINTIPILPSKEQG